MQPQLPPCVPASCAGPRCAEQCWEQCLKSCCCGLRDTGSWGLDSLCAVGRERRRRFGTWSYKSREMLAMPLERWDGQHRTCRLRTSWGSSLAEETAAGTSLRSSCTGMCSTHPSLAAVSRHGLWAGSHCSVCCRASSMLVMVLNTSTTPLCLLWVVCLPLPILHIQHPSPHPLTVPIQPRQAASCKEPCETHGARAELGHSFIRFALGISQPYCSRGLTSPGRKEQQGMRTA